MFKVSNAYSKADTGELPQTNSEALKKSNPDFPLIEQKMGQEAALQGKEFPACCEFEEGTPEYTLFQRAFEKTLA